MSRRGAGRDGCFRSFRRLVNGHASHAKNLIDSQTLVIQVYTLLNVRLFDSHCPPEIYLPRETKLEPDFRLVREKPSVR